MKSDAEMKKGWQPIETVPKDGIVIDLWHKAGFRIPEVTWVVDEGFFAHDGAGLFDGFYDSSLFVYWKPVTKPEGVIEK